MGYVPSNETAGFDERGRIRPSIICVSIRAFSLKPLLREPVSNSDHLEAQYSRPQQNFLILPSD